jgi:hypothetical protein
MGNKIQWKAEEEKIFRETIQESREIGLSTDKGNPKKARELINKIIEVDDKNAPPFFFFQSPLAVELAVLFAENYEQKFRKIPSEKEIKDFLPADMSREENILNAKKEVKGSFPYLSGNRNFGQFDLSWLSIYEACRRAGINYTSTQKEWLSYWYNLAKETCYWVAFEEAIFASQKPCELHFNENDLLHNTTGPAIKFRDGFQIFLITGVIVPRNIVENPSEQDINDLINEPNEELKRIKISQFGWERFVNQANMEILDTRDNPIENTKEILGSIEDMKVLVCHCPSQGKIFVLEVAPEVSSCEEAQNYMHGSSNVDSLIGKTRVIGRS